MNTVANRTPARPHPVILARVAGLPTSVVTELATPVTAALLTELLDLDQRLRAEGAALSDLLHPVIGRLNGTPAKPLLVALRRAVYQVRPGQELLDKTAGNLPEEIRARIEAWTGDLARRDTLRSGLNTVLTDEITAAAPTLRGLARHPALQRGLVTNSPDLRTGLGGWLASDDPRRLPSNRVLGTLVRYLLRAAVKTSPRATFTASGLGRWESGSACASLADQLLVTSSELHAGLVTLIIDKVMGLPAVSEHARIRVNPSCHVDEHAVQFLGLPSASSVVSVKRLPEIETCLALAREEKHTVAGLRRELAARADGERLVAVAGRLVELGLLVPHAPVADQEEDRLAELVNWLDTLSAAKTEPVVAETITGLRTLGDAMARYDRETDPDRCARLLDEANAELSERTARLGVLKKRDDTWLRRSFHENAGFRRDVVTCDPHRLAPALDDLDTLRPLLGLFDSNTALRIVLGRYLAQEWGPGARVPFLTFYRHLHGAHDEGRSACAISARQVLGLLPRPDLRPMPSDVSIAELRDLQRVRRAVRAELAAMLDKTGDQEGIDSAQLRALAGRVPASLAAPGSIAVYAQLAGETDPLLVVNMITGGYGRGRGRVRRMTGREAGPPSAGAGRVLVAEIDQLFDSSLSARAPEHEYGIDYPGAVPRRSADRLIPLGELVVAGRSRSDPVVEWTRDGSVVFPVHTSLHYDRLLPPAIQLLVNGFGAAPNLLRGPHALTQPGSAGTEAVHAIPRLRLGRLVLRRASWTTRLGEVPARSPGEDEAAWMLRMLAWLRRWDIPTRCFVHVVPDGGTSSVLPPKDHKPHYADFTSWFHLVALKRMLSGDPGQLVRFEEALPDPDQALPTAEGTRHVTELIFELGEECR